MGTPSFTENGRRIFDLRYPIKDEEGLPTETPEQVIVRVATNVASVTGLYGGIAELRRDHDGVLHPSTVLATEKWQHTPSRLFQWLRQQPSEEHLDASLPQLLIAGYEDFQIAAHEYEHMITELRFLPNSPTWTGAGTPLGQLAACFVLPISDDLGRRRDSIFETLRVAALIQQTGGGNGFDLSSMRPSNAIVQTSMGRASGPIGFLRVYDAAFGQIAQGGSRRGANMGVLRVDHPDIREFITAKVVEGEIANFNLSVAITDDFMDATLKDEDFDLTFGGKVHETVKARELYHDIIQNAWVMGDPGNLFIDRANRDNPCPTRYRLAATNPCGEQWLGPYENCCLGSIAVQQFAHWGTSSTFYGEFDWEAFAQTVIQATRFLDDVVDANQYVPDVPELEEAAQGGRRIGLGLMGLADAMAKMGIRYGSPEGLDFASQLTEYARFYTMMASIQRAQERGPFPWIEHSIYDQKFLANGEGVAVTAPMRPSHADFFPSAMVEFRTWMRPQSVVEHTIDFGRPNIDWDLVYEGILRHGIRNSCQFTFAPTGTISNVAGCEGSGCEPFFALAFERTVMQEGDNLKLAYASGLFEEALRIEGFNDDEITQIAEMVRDNGGSCQGLDGVPEWIRHSFVVAADVTPEEHVWTQAVLQAWVDNSISKTINMPNEATTTDVANAYALAYKLGCKGITVYRQGSRELEVLSTTPKAVVATGLTHTPVVVEREVWGFVDPIAIPADAGIVGLPARVFPVETFYGKVQVTITEHPDHPGRPFDVRLQVGKAGNDTNAHVEALGRTISLALRGGIHVKDIVNQLEGIGGSSVHGFGPNRVKSVADGIAKLLRSQYLEAPDAEPVVYEQVRVAAITDAPVADKDQLCPNCGNASLVMEAGCRHCDIRLGGCGEYSGCD